MDAIASKSGELRAKFAFSGERSSERCAPERAKPHVLSGEELCSDVTRRVVERVLDRADDRAQRALEDAIYETIYAEQARLSHAEPGTRANEDRAFIARLRREFVHGNEDDFKRLIYTIVERYSQEIAGHFDLRAYRLATRVVPPALSVLLHGLDVTRARAFDVDDRILIEGDTRSLLALCRIGTVVLAPTHVSNLDSLVMGSTIHRLGLPPFAYAAGLNLFSNRLTGFFMRHLGAYTVDRKKSDPLYLETLKEYATVLVERGQHNLVFPGGTRSRSGAIEHELKLGLLGTGPVAYRHALVARAPRPRVFIVPCTLSYPLVLEAATLVSDYLKFEGGPRYLDVRDEFDRPRRWYDFLSGLRRLDLRVHVRFSRPLDWLGNEVDERGVSHDQRGHALDLTRYLCVNGELAADDARDMAYTRVLAKRILGAYKRDNVALPTSIAGFVVFSCFHERRGRLDLFRFLRSLDPELGVPVAEVLEELGRVLARLEQLRDNGEIALSDDVCPRDPRALLERALATFATYHPVPVVQRRGEALHVLDPELLFYYRNRLEGYGLSGSRQTLAQGVPAHRRGHT